MKLTFAVLSLAVLFCTAQGASIGNADELNPLVTTVTSKISNLLQRVESEDEVAHMTEAVEEIQNAAEIVISKTSKMMHNGNAINGNDVRKVDIMKFIAEKAVSADEVVKVLFTEDQLTEDNWRVVLLMRSLGISGEGLKFDFARFTSASNEGDKSQELNNVKVWCQAIVKISGAMVSAIDDAEITLRSQLGIFSDEQQVSSDGKGAVELSPTEEKGSSEKHHRQRRAWRSSGNWGLDNRGVTWTSGSHTIWGGPTFSGGFRPSGARIGYTFTF